MPLDPSITQDLQLKIKIMKKKLKYASSPSSSSHSTLTEIDICTSHVFYFFVTFAPFFFGLSLFPDPVPGAKASVSTTVVLADVLKLNLQKIFIYYVERTKKSK